ncbi:MAG: ATP-binding protein [Beijerinckiaceae bacterium]|nr:ATP-binding protein [Beijerinckiaceae bacterium]
MIADFIERSVSAKSVTVGLASRSEQPPMLTDERWEPRQHPGHGRGAGRGMRGGMMHGPLGDAVMSWRGLSAKVELHDGQWLAFTTSLPDEGPKISFHLLLALAVMTGIIAILTAWAARRLTAPLRVLSDAATRLGHDVDAAPLAVTGSVELRRAAEAFNDMQSRLRSLIANRTLMLAAISHDLRTQLTLLRLRTEMAPANEDKERMLRTISDLEEMLTETLSFARDEAQSEPRKLVDVGALITSIIDDMADAGMPVASGKIPEGAVIECKTAALRRAVVNLIDNAVKYGAKATVSLEKKHEGITINVDDEGPGIPEEQIALVLQPFYRLETSRSRDTGGIGLGLAITTSIIEAQDGRLSLTNRNGGGLRAAIILPSDISRHLTQV